MAVVVSNDGKVQWLAKGEAQPSESLSVRGGTLYVSTRNRLTCGECGTAHVSRYVVRGWVRTGRENPVCPYCDHRRAAPQTHQAVKVADNRARWRVFGPPPLLTLEWS